jgi:hypothetical protein
MLHLQRQLHVGAEHVIGETDRGADAARRAAGLDQHDRPRGEGGVLNGRLKLVDGHRNSLSPQFPSLFMKLIKLLLRIGMISIVLMRFIRINSEKKKVREK